ncbi:MULTISPECIES: hypothetical protein [Leptospira]|uniref:Uncharacterized protein n=2 Tax=Leptospira interrogans TaxID=173 RepID=M6G8C2_LEPIR|nr:MULTISPECIES: hypothetical protein [Leptospira]EJP17943.1 hypothetical protein LEP1GSC080_4842 [Leptospira interrogans str. FPW2026]EMM80995.1 hypothetical protein LEP1GSC037_0319 [Leptospira interrogans str. 2006001854]QOI52964.1 hypothetical protein Lepto1489_21450 [Leptospira interrogans serovar Bataviae]
MLESLLKSLDDPDLISNHVLPWGSPIPVFGDVSNSRVATLGLNPSNREFMDADGKELEGEKRRFHTLKSLNISSWSRVKQKHLDLIDHSYRNYFNKNPYDSWFRILDKIISGTKASFYNKSNKACHLDLVPYATSCKWAELSGKQQTRLFQKAGDTLAFMLRESSIRVIVLNGKTVVDAFQKISNQALEKELIPEWTLPRRSGIGVPGFSYKGIINQINGQKLRENIYILGFNHNLQSSFGVTNVVKNSIQDWISHSFKKIENETKR